jgi:hypothetical protein
MCVRMQLCMCPLYMCPHTAVYVSHTLLRMLLAHAAIAAIYVSAYCVVVVLILLHTCPHQACAADAALADAVRSGPAYTCSTGSAGGGGEAAAAEQSHSGGAGQEQARQGGRGGFFLYKIFFV